MKKRRIWPFFSVRNQIIFIIYVVMFPVLIVTGFSIHRRNTDSVLSEYTRQYQSSVEVLNSSVGYFEQDLMDILSYVIVNNDVGRVLRASASLGEEDPLFWKSLSPMNFVNDMLNLKGNIRTFILYPENGLVPFYSSQDGSVMVKDIGNIRSLPLYQRAVEAQGDTVWTKVPSGISGLFEKNRSDKIVLAREIFDGAKRNRLGFLALSVDVSQYESMCESSLLYPHDGILMVDSDYSEIARAGQVSEAALRYVAEQGVTETLRAPSGAVEAVEGTYIFAAPRGTDGWIFYFSPKSAWDARIRAGLTQSLLLGLALLISVWPISILASRIISKPMLRLHTSMNRFKEGDFSQQIQVVGNDEIAELSETFNDMVLDMKKMIDREYVMVLREKESELDALQAQINPHFLYNALDSLYWQATDAGQEALAENILSLSELFRLVLSSGHSEITVRQEIRLITNYLHIQKMRFAKKLDFTVEVDDDILDFTIPKLILQPFVENAIVHGLERMDSWGCVKVQGSRQGDLLEFVIEDNGIGISREKLGEILFAREDSRYANQRIGAFAIRNVKERMTLRYGERATLAIESEPGRGTRVCLRIPLDPKDPPA